MYCSVMIFCGEEMGDVKPPMQLASAIPRSRQGATGELSSRVRKMGSMSEKHNTGVATFDIHMLRKAETNMTASRTHRGRVPACASTREAKALAMPYFERAPAMANPPSSIMIVLLNIDENTALEALAADNGRPSSVCSMPSGTTRNGIRSDVAYRGMASVAHNMDANTSSAKQWFSCVAPKMLTFKRMIKTVSEASNAPSE